MSGRRARVEPASALTPALCGNPALGIDGRVTINVGVYLPSIGFALCRRREGPGGAGDGTGPVAAALDNRRVHRPAERQYRLQRER